MTFLQCVTRIFQQMAIIRGDTDAPASFSDTQHNASLGVAQVCVQDELINLIARRLLPKERSTSGSITLVANTRVYNLASDFLRFYGIAHLFNDSDDVNIPRYQGGLEQLQIDDVGYLDSRGTPNWWYDEPSSAATKQVGFYPVPNAAKTITYDYEASTLVTLAADSLPFHNNEEAYSFTIMAGRRFKYMWGDTKAEADISMILEKDYSYRTARATLYALLKPENASRRYGNSYS